MDIVKGDEKSSDVDEALGGGVTWDEPTIAEHDKERGTRTKISEPKTPFSHEHGTFSSDDETSLSSGMDVDRHSNSDSAGSSPRHSNKHSPRFVLPPSSKKPNLGTETSADSGHKHEHTHVHTAKASSEHSHDSKNSGSPTDSIQMEPGNRKIRSSNAAGIDPESLQLRVAQVKEERTQDDRKHFMDVADEEAESESEEEEFLTPQERAKKTAFAEKRKQHYNEFKRMKELLSGQGGDDEDSDSSDEE